MRFYLLLLKIFFPITKKSQIPKKKSAPLLTTRQSSTFNNVVQSPVPENSMGYITTRRGSNPRTKTGLKEVPPHACNICYPPARLKPDPGSQNRVFLLFLHRDTKDTNKKMFQCEWRKKCLGFLLPALL